MNRDGKRKEGERHQVKEVAAQGKEDAMTGNLKTNEDSSVNASMQSFSFVVNILFQGISNILQCMN